LPKRLRTSDKRIELAPDVLVKDVERVKAKLLDWDRGRPVSKPSTSSSPGEPLSANGHLLLIGRRQLRSNNSWMHNSQRLVKGQSGLLGKPRCTILMHPTDAAHRDLKPGQTVSVRSRVGTLSVPIEISDEMMPGVVSIPHGWGHDRLGVQLEVAQQHAGGSINDITDNLTVDALCGTAAFNGTWVVIEPAN
jgi:anaerobic selenocysteine-containing dehydrogenase